MPDPAPCPIELDIAEPRPSRVDIGAAFSLTLVVTPRANVDLCGARCVVRDGERPVFDGPLAAIKRFDPNDEDYDPRNGPVETRDCATVTLTAPTSEGTFTWTVVLPAQDKDGIPLAQASAVFSFTTVRHRTSLAVWDVPTPVVSGTPMRVKVGAKCSAGCRLTGQRVTVTDRDGGLIATGELGEAPLVDAEGLYVAVLELPAPQACALIEWRAGFAADDLELPHQGTSASLSFTTTRPPQHRVCITVVESATRAPIAQAQVRLGDCRLATDTGGRATFHVPSGQQRLFVWEAEHAIPEQVVDVDRDLEIAIEATHVPRPNPYDRWDG